MGYTCTARRVARGGSALAVALSLLSSSDAGAAQKSKAAPECRPAGAVVRIAELPEGSGVAMSQRVPGRLWTHNDSGQPVLFALDTAGLVTGRISLPGVKVEDWEAIAVGPCPGGSCIYVADIGDNDAERKRITIYRVPEPAGASDAPKTAEVFHATYPDGAHDAETLLIAPDGGMFIVTKGDTRPIALYRFPRELKSGASVQLERVGKPRADKPTNDDRITDGDVSPDGTWVALRTNRAVTLHRMTDLMAGNWREAQRVDLKALGEPQGEGVAFGADNMLYVSGEGGGKSQPGTFARLTCTPAS